MDVGEDQCDNFLHQESVPIVNASVKVPKTLSRFKAVRFQEYKMHWGTTGLASVCDVHRLFPETLDVKKDDDSLDNIPLERLPPDFKLGTGSSQEAPHYHIHCYNKKEQTKICWVKNTGDRSHHKHQFPHASKCEINKKQMRPKQTKQHNINNFQIQVTKVINKCINKSAVKVNTKSQLPCIKENSVSFSNSLNSKKPYSKPTCFCSQSDLKTKIPLLPIKFWAEGSEEDIYNFTNNETSNLEEISDNPPPSSPMAAELSPVSKKSTGRFTVLTLEKTSSCSSVKTLSPKSDTCFFLDSPTSENAEGNNVFVDIEPKRQTNVVDAVTRMCRNHRPDIATLFTTERVQNAFSKCNINHSNLDWNYDVRGNKEDLQNIVQKLTHVVLQCAENESAIQKVVERRHSSYETSKPFLIRSNSLEAGESIVETRLEEKLTDMTFMLQDTLKATLLAEITPLQTRIAQLLEDSVRKDKEAIELVDNMEILQRIIGNKDKEIQRYAEQLREQESVSSALCNQLAHTKTALHYTQTQVADLEHRLTKTVTELSGLRRQLEPSPGATRLSRLGRDERSSFSRFL